MAWVSLTTSRQNSDQTCVLNAGDHPFVRHETVVGYSRADLQNTTKLSSGLASGQLICDDNVRPDVLVRIQQGALRSKHTKNEVKDFLRLQGIR